MAEYKGLTIRIGGDTSQLNSALKASTKAAASLQSQIRQITRAMRFDPADFGNLNTRVKLSENRMEALYSKLRLVRNGYAELGKQAVTVGGSATNVRALAKATQNVEVAAKAADKRYEDVTASLAAMYREFEKLGTASIKRALSMEGADEEVDAVIAKFRELGIVTRDAAKDVDLIKLDLSDAGRAADIDELLADMKTLGALTDEQIESNRLMRETFKEALGDKDAYDKAAQFQRMGVDMQRIRSEAEGMAASMREMNTVSRYASGTWSESAAKVRSVDAAMSSCAKQARAYEEALRKDPANLSAAVGRLKALANEYDLAKDKARELSRQVRAYESRLSETLAKEKNLPEYIQRTGDAWQKAQAELAEARGKANALGQSLQRLKDAQAPVGEMMRLEAEVREADARVDALAASARKLDSAFETAKECAELQRLQGELSGTEAHAMSLKKRMDLTSLGGKSVLNASTVKSIGMSLYSTLTPAITMLGWRTVTAAQDMDTAYRDMRKTVEGTESQFESLKQGAIEFSKTHVTSATQILQIEAIGGELGIATENLQAFAETVSNLDVATNLDTEDAASSLGKLANITHMTADEYDNYADALVRLGNNGASTEDQIVDIATRIGSMGTIVGMTVPEILALSSSIASTGMKTEASGTAIANTLSDMESAVAGGGDALQAFADVSGMSAEEFAQTWQDKPIAAFEAFIKGLNGIEKSGGSADATLEAMGITGTRQKQAIEGLMQTIDGLDDSLQMSNDAWEGRSDAWGAAGDAAREASKKAEGFSGQLAILSNIGNNAMAALAEGATPIIAALTDLAEAAFDTFNGMDDDAKTAVVALLGVAAVSGPLLTLSSSMVIAKNNMVAFFTESTAMGRAIGILKSGFVDLGGGMEPALTKTQSMKLALRELGTGLAKGLAVGAAIAAIGLLVAAVADFIDKAEKGKAAAKNAGDVISEALGEPVDGARENVESLSGRYGEMVEQMAKSNKAIQESAERTYGKTALIEQYGKDVRAALKAYNAGDRSAESMANLKSKLDLYNDAAGTAIGLSEKANGKLQLMKDGAKLSAKAFDELTASMMNNAKAEFFKESYTAKMADYRTALDGVADAEAEVARLEAERARAVDNQDWGAATALSEELAHANGLLDESKAKLGETTSAMNQYEEGMKLMAEAQLENASGAVLWVSEQDRLQASIWSNCESVTEFAHGLEGLGVGYDELSAHEEDITSMATTWDGSTDQIIEGLRGVGIELDLSKAKVDGLAKAKIGGKTYYVTDNGTILDQEGALAGFKAITIDGKTYYVDDAGTIFNGKKEIGSLKNGIATIKGKTYRITDGGSAAASKKDTDALASSIKEVKDKKVSVSASVSGKSLVEGLVSAISSLKDKTVDVVTRHTEVHSATGSVSSSPYIPRHAAGYVAAGATLTNNGWVGEAGAEAVLNWGTGGAVVPLTNRKYMLPIANAIAENMGRGGGSETRNVTVYLQYDASSDAAQMAGDIARMLDRKLAMEG